MAEEGEPNILDYLKTLAEAIWGNPQAILKHDDRTGLEYIDLSGHVEAFHFLEVGTEAEDQKILVREEYRVALQALETDDDYKKAAYVTGQRGIGKTLFLAYILVIRLGRKQAVAWQLSADCGIPGYVMLRETASFHDGRNTMPLYRFSPVWALSDSSPGSLQPMSIFYHARGHVKTIQTTSPREHRWKEWSKYTSAGCYVMDIWSVEEIADLARILNLDVERMSYLAKKWGGAPRRILRFFPRSDEMIEKSYKDNVANSVKGSKEILSAIEANNYEAPSPFYFCRPRIHPMLGLRRMFPRAVVPTATLRSLLAEGLREQDNHTRLTFFRALERCDGTRSTAGYIFENWFHNFFLASHVIECYWLRSLPGVSSLQGTNTLIPTSWSNIDVARPPYYWVAPNDFPGIDCALVLATEIYAIRVTLSSEHPSPIEGLQKLREHLPQDLKNLAWKLLFVGDSASSAAAAAGQWLGKIPFRPPGKPLAIGWSALDPVSDLTPWKARRLVDSSRLF